MKKFGDENHPPIAAEGSHHAIWLRIRQFIVVVNNSPKLLFSCIFQGRANKVIGSGFYSVLFKFSTVNFGPSRWQRCVGIELKASNEGEIGATFAFLGGATLCTCKSF